MLSVGCRALLVVRCCVSLCVVLVCVVFVVCCLLFWVWFSVTCSVPRMTSAALLLVVGRRAVCALVHIYIFFCGV